MSGERPGAGVLRRLLPRRPWTLRRQLVGLVLAVVLPFIALGAYQASQSLGERAHSAQLGARTVAEMAAARIADLMDDAAATAEALASRAAALGQAGCSGLGLGELLRLETELASVFVTHPDGGLRCSALDESPLPGLTAADRSYFGAALAADTVVFSEAIFGRVSRAWIVIAARAVRTPAGEVRGVAGASVDVASLRPAADDVDLSRSQVVLVVDRDGSVLARSQDEAAWIGRLVDTSAVVAQALASGGGLARGHDIDGTERLWGYARVPRVDWVVLAGEDAALALADERRSLVHSMALGAIIAGVVLTLALFLAARIGRPVRALSLATGAVERGEFTAMAPVEGPAELVEVARGFNAMVMARKKAEVALRASEVKFERAFGASPVPMAISTFPEGLVIDVNDAYVDAFGWSREEILGRNALDLGLWCHPADREAAKADLQAFRPVRNREYEFRKKSGEVVIALFSADRVELGGRPCVVSLLVDITDRRGLEAQLRQAQKMEALGQLTGGIAHDFNNLLTAVLGNAELLADELPPTAAPLREEADAIKAAALRGATMVRKLLAFARQERLTLEPVDLAEVCRDSASVLRRLIPETIEIRFTPAVVASWVMADRGAVDQILLNLATNARDAMPEGGTLRIETGSAVLDEGFRRMHGFGDPGVYGTLVVSDTGLGMSEQVRQRVFEPFFTTKPRGQGTGLGMATVYGLVKQHAGYVGISTAPGRGTAITVYFPAADVEADRTTPDTAGPEFPRGQETVLLVEDEALIRDVSRRLLERHGYRVLVAGDGEAALTVLQGETETVDLVVTDVVMPHRTGPELLRAVQRLDRQPRFLFTSGYADLGAADLDTIRQGAFLPKPWSAEELLVKVRTILDREDVAE